MRQESGTDKKDQTRVSKEACYDTGGVKTSQWDVQDWKCGRVAMRKSTRLNTFKGSYNLEEEAETAQVINTTRRGKSSIKGAGSGHFVSRKIRKKK